MRRSMLFAMALLLMASSAIAADGPRLLLAGGAVPVCSNVSPRVCAAGRVPAPPPLANQYRLDEAGIERVAQAWWQPHRAAEHKRIVVVLRQWLAQAGLVDFSADALPDALQLGDRAASAWTSLAGFEQSRVLDALQRAPPAERVALADSTAGSGAVIYREFVAMARSVSGRQQPRILISTASSRDPYDAIEFYLAVFAQAGAQARWLPLDHALRAAQANPDVDCGRLDRLRGERWGAQDRARLHPRRAQELQAACRDSALLREQLTWADGLFLNGGDQSFTRAAWYAAEGTPAPEWVLVQQRLDAGKLVLGGSSAGTTVQAAHPGVMLVSGPAVPNGAAVAIRQLPPDPGCAVAAACGGVDPDALLMQPDGGLGSFPLGILDTHFSERGREYRLARLLLDSGAKLGVGIDENTALRLDRRGANWRAKVIGSAAVTLLWRLNDHRLAWVRHRASADFLWPSVPAAATCDAPSSAPHTLRAGSTELRDALLAADQRTAVPLRLQSGGRLQNAGQVCVGSTPEIRIWEFPAVSTALPASDLRAAVDRSVNGHFLIVAEQDAEIVSETADPRGINHNRGNHLLK